MLEAFAMQANDGSSIRFKVVSGVEFSSDFPPSTTPANSEDFFAF